MRLDIPAVTVTAICPLCYGQLVLKHSKHDHVAYIGCTRFPQCEYRAPFHPILQNLRDKVARLEAELELAKLQACPDREDHRPITPAGMIRWRDVAHLWQRTVGADGKEVWVRREEQP